MMANSWCLMMVGTLLAGAVANAGEPTPDADPRAAQTRVLQAIYREGADRYEFFADAERETKLTREVQPVLHWASPNDWSGDIFVWQRLGRPEVVGCILSGPANAGGRMFFHEFHALTLKPLPPQQLPDGKVWAPESTGVEFRPIPDAPLPADAKPARLVQMRNLAKQFDVRTHFDNAEWELRLLPQPMFRYQPPPQNASPDWLDGALFTYVLTTGTDAEVLILIEARKTEGGAWQWQYAPARITNRPAWIRLGEEEVWRVEGHSEEAGTITRPYTTFYAGTRSMNELKPGAGPAREAIKASAADGEEKPAPLPAPSAPK